MSSAPEVFPFGNPSEPAFETALRGYEKKQVERYVQQVEAEVAALVAEREELYGQIGLLNQHIQQLQHELNTRRYAAPSRRATSPTATWARGPSRSSRSPRSRPPRSATGSAASWPSGRRC